MILMSLHLGAIGPSADETAGRRNGESEVNRKEILDDVGVRRES